MIFPQLGQFTDLGLLLLRVMVALVFFDSGRRSFFQAAERSQSIGNEHRLYSLPRLSRDGWCIRHCLRRT